MPYAYSRLSSRKFMTGTLFTWLPPTTRFERSFCSRESLKYLFSAALPCTKILDFLPLETHRRQTRIAGFISLFIFYSLLVGRLGARGKLDAACQQRKKPD
jgi:hypothetical protein